MLELMWWGKVSAPGAKQGQDCIGVVWSVACWLESLGKNTFLG